MKSKKFSVLSPLFPAQAVFVSYDNYLESASPQRQKSAFKRAKEYDRLSGAALIGMEAGIILSTYLIFF